MSSEPISRPVACSVPFGDGDDVSCDADQLASFPEDRFLPRVDRRDQYRALVRRGYQIMRGRRVIMACVARDVAAHLPATIARFEKLGRLFADYRVVVYENDSRDATLTLLDQWSRRNRRVAVLSEVRNDPPNLPVRCPLRGTRMAHYRNRYLEYIAAQKLHFDDAIVADADLMGGWSYDGIAHTYGHDNWDFMGSYGIIFRRVGWDPHRIYHYDAWAFRLDEGFQPLSTKQVNHMNWQRGEPLVRVSSCFGGLGIYRLEALLAGRYDGGDCEHIALHRSMRQKGFDRVFLNPSQITVYGRKLRRLDKLFSLCQRLSPL